MITPSVVALELLIADIGKDEGLPQDQTACRCKNTLLNFHGLHIGQVAFVSAMSFSSVAVGPATV